MNNDHLQALRQRAIKRLENRHGEVTAMPTQDVKSLIHELEVSQVELEVQNDELRKTEMKLAAALAHYQDLFENAPVGYLSLDANGKILRANGAAAQLCSREGDDLEGILLERLIVEADRAALFGLLRGAEYGRQQAGELRIARPVACTPRWVHVDVCRPKTDGDDRLLRLTLTDITPRKQAEAETLQSEERLRLAQEGAKLGAFEWNVETGVNTWSPALEAMYGLEPGKFGKTQSAWENLVHPDDLAAAKRAVSHTLETGEPVEAEWRIRMPTGEVRWISGRFQAFKDAAGTVQRLIGVNMDITDRKRAEEEIRRASADLRLANEELKKFNRAMVGRELRMVELKREVNELCSALGEERRYALDFER